MSERSIKRRTLPQDHANWPWPHDMPALLRRIYAARLQNANELDYRLQHLLAPRMQGMDAAIARLLDAREKQQSILIAGDYDCDGATASAVAVRGLQLLGFKQVDFVVPNRAAHGYGLSPKLVQSLPHVPDVIVTVDNGIAAVDGVAAANALGVDVIVTDHHLPGKTLPAALAIVNPNRDGETFPGKTLAGVGVMFYVLLALRSRLREQGVYTRATQPRLSALLDLVAIGTVADLVPLDYNNRILVAAGLRRIRSGQAHAGVNALIAASGRLVRTLTAGDIAFAIAPRLNAAGRLDDMHQGIACLLSDHEPTAHVLVQKLDDINRTRKELQQEMVSEAEAIAAAMLREHDLSHHAGIVLYEPHWHAGIVGLVASKIKDKLYRPVIAFAPADADDTQVLRGSARSIAGLHIRDVLADVVAAHPGMVLRFGGHAMAAGLSLPRQHLAAFTQAFNAMVNKRLDVDTLQQTLWSDGDIPPGELTLRTARQLHFGGPWGQHFPLPLFDQVFDVIDTRVMGGRHWRFTLRDPRDPRDRSQIEAVMFNVDVSQAVPRRMHALFELALNQWQGRQKAQLIIRHFQAA